MYDCNHLYTPRSALHFNCGLREEIMYHLLGGTWRRNQGAEPAQPVAWPGDNGHCASANHTSPCAPHQSGAVNLIGASHEQGATREDTKNVSCRRPFLGRFTSFHKTRQKREDLHHPPEISFELA
jgi:hypothetical protein